MSILRVQQVDGEARFQVVRVKDAKTAPVGGVHSPADCAVEGRPDSNLLKELRWYLEEFLDYPYSPNTERADRILAALKQWGEEAFNVLFDNRQGADFLREAQDGGRYDRLNLQIASDDPRVLAWPWEALEDPLTGRLALTCQIERRLNRVADPQPLDPRLPKDCVNVLLVTARPMKKDVRYRSISRPLVELLADLPAHVTVLRPPTFDALRRHLDEHPYTYHVLHFDGHGGYGSAHAPHAGGHCYHAEGVLVFEKEDQSEDPIKAEQLTSLLREHAVPAVVLNACQSAMIDERAEDPFASVAAALLKSGMRGVVAMAYTLYVSGARLFVPVFYERLFETGDVAQALRAGRQKMYAEPGRICARGEHPLQDWLVPVVYQQDPLDFSFAAKARPGATRRESKLPREARDTENPYGFIGRDGPLLDLERALRRPPAGILIQGLAGVGKTTLARGFVEWLEATDGLGCGCMWLTFKDIRSAEFVINRMGEPIFGGQFAASGAMAAKVDRLAGALRENRVVIVWDNFEVVRGIPGTSVTANLTAADCDVLKALLTKLRGGKSKVIITSRGPEEWLGHENCFELPIGGLDGDERWEYCAAVLNDLGLKPKRDDGALAKLMELLGGHPLAMRAILPQLRRRTATQLAEALRGNLDALDLPQDEVGAKLAATLRFVQDDLPAEQRPLLVPLSLHEGFVDADYLEAMAKQVEGHLTRPVIDRLTEALGTAGLLRDRGQAIFELHPALTGYLRAAVARDLDGAVRDGWARAFVEVMWRVADTLAPKELHEQRFGFHVHGASFRHALTEAERLEMDLALRALLQSLASFAQNTRDFAAAMRLHERRAEADRAAGDHKHEAAAYHQLGIIAEEQRDFAAAEQCYRKALAVFERLGIEHGAAGTYHQLGRIAQEQRDFAAAEQWYRKSLAIKEKQGDEHGAASTYHQLGMLAQEQRDFGAAEQWYRKSLAIEEKQGNEHGAASTYHQLGRIAEEQRDFAAAEQWYRKSLAISEKQGNEHGAASTYGQLGILAGLQERYEEAGRWLIKCVTAFARCNDPQGVHQTAANFMVIYRETPSDVQDKLAAMWREAGLGELPETPGQ